MNNDNIKTLADMIDALRLRAKKYEYNRGFFNDCIFIDGVGIGVKLAKTPESEFLSIDRYNQTFFGLQSVNFTSRELATVAIKAL